MYLLMVDLLLEDPQNSENQISSDRITHHHLRERTPTQSAVGVVQAVRVHQAAVEGEAPGRPGVVHLSGPDQPFAWNNGPY